MIKLKIQLLILGLIVNPLIFVSYSDNFLFACVSKDDIVKSNLPLPSNTKNDGLICVRCFLSLTIISLKTWLIQIISKNRLALLKSILRQIEKVKNETVLVDGNHEYFNIFELFKSLN